jgi:hypothetical protein
MKLPALLCFWNKEKNTFQDAEITRFVCGPNRIIHKHSLFILKSFLASSLSLHIDRVLKFHYVGNTAKSLRQLAPPRISSKIECVTAGNWLRNS